MTYLGTGTIFFFEFQGHTEAIMLYSMFDQHPSCSSWEDTVYKFSRCWPLWPICTSEWKFLCRCMSAMILYTKSGWIPLFKQNNIEERKMKYNLTSFFLLHPEQPKLRRSFGHSESKRFIGPLELQITLFWIPLYIHTCIHNNTVELKRLEHL